MPCTLWDALHQQLQSSVTWDCFGLIWEVRSGSCAASAGWSFPHRDWMRTQRHHDACRRVYWERMIGLNRHWQSVEWREGEKPLVVHYAGCSFCSPPTDKITEKQVWPCIPC